MKENDWLWHCSVNTDIGTREEQQDSAYVYPEDGELLAIVCDGMGGLNSGSVASSITVSTLVNKFKARDREEKISDFFMKCVDILDESVFSLKNEYRERLYAGTTLVAANIKGNELNWMSIGDSRLYIFRGGEFLQATRDHNYFMTISSMPKDYIPTPEEISKGDALISYIGIGGIDVMDISNNSFVLENGDCILLTTDGLYKSLTDAEIKKIIENGSDTDKISGALMNAAKEASPDSRDNTTFILIYIGGNQLETGKM